MSKELEALEWLEKLFSWGRICDTTLALYNTIKQALTELKAIKNSNPSEALDCLGSIYVFSGDYNDGIYRFEKEKDIIKQYILNAQQQEKLLSILKEKRIDLESFYTDFIENIFDYNYYEKSYGTYGLKCLTEEEFNALKEWIK